MAGTVVVQANVTAVVAAGVLPLRRQTVCLWTENTFDSGGEKMASLAPWVTGHAYLCSLDELLSSCLLVLLMSPPGSEGGRLQGSAKGEGQDPGRGQRAVVDGVQVDRSLLFALTSGEKSYPCGPQQHPPFNPER